MSYREKVMLLWPAPESVLTVISAADAEIARLQAENERLRNSLKKIISLQMDTHYVASAALNARQTGEQQ